MPWKAENLKKEHKLRRTKKGFEQHKKNVTQFF